MIVVYVALATFAAALLVTGCWLIWSFATWVQERSDERKAHHERLIGELRAARAKSWAAKKVAAIVKQGEMIIAMRAKE